MHALDLIGVFAFAVSGALMAIARDYDVVGIAILAVVTALGGGIVRDLVLGTRRFRRSAGGSTWWWPWPRPRSPPSPTPGSGG
ncbi:trimeric intracellular cation channel family protein [Blastococcus sp. SYSU DS1024]